MVALQAEAAARASEVQRNRFFILADYEMSKADSAETGAEVEE